MSRFIDRGAVVAAYVGIGMAAVIAVSFLLVIPIPIIYALLALPAGLLIGYYADSRSGPSLGETRPETGPDRGSGADGPPAWGLSWRRIVANGLFAGLVTAASLGILIVAVDALFFYADNGYRDQRQGAALQCQAGPGCVYERYLADGRGPDLEREGVTDVGSFTAFYWGQQLTTAGTIFALTLVGSLGGALAYGAVRPRPGRERGRPSDGTLPV